MSNLSSIRHDYPAITSGTSMRGFDNLNQGLVQELADFIQGLKFFASHSLLPTQAYAAP
jgi:hypothetical protein